MVTASVVCAVYGIAVLAIAAIATEREKPLTGYLRKCHICFAVLRFQ